MNLQHGSEIKAAPMPYDIQTWGWTIDAVAHPFKGFDFHFLFTYQKPTYKKYETSVTFNDGIVGRIAMTNLVFPVAPYENVKLYTQDGKAEFKNLKVHKLGL